MQAVNRIILDKAVSDVELIPKLAHHLIDSGGKRLRPMLTIAAAKLCGYRGDGHVRLAAAVEFMHTATLLHDDVVDESDYRRGKASARLRVGQPGERAGRRLPARPGVPHDGGGRLARRAQDPVERRRRDRRGRGDAARRRQEHGHHRGRLPRHHQRQDGGAVLGRRRGRRGASPTGPAEEQAALKSYGRNLGIAFQLVDDALDYSGDSSRLGKSVGDDFREGKITLPVILCFRRGSEDERAFWKRTLSEGKIEDGDLEHAIALMKKHNAIEATLERAAPLRRHRPRCAGHLPHRPPHAARSTDVIGFCISRAS